VRGSDPVEAALLRVETYIAQAPLGANYLTILETIAADLLAILTEIDPNAPKQGQRLAIINTAVAKGAAGIPDLLTYIDDKPSHPDDTTKLAQWEAVQLGYEPEVSTISTVENVLGDPVSTVETAAG
jgi:hypothetical protein